jgi:hypothetical protein
LEKFSYGLASVTKKLACVSQAGKVKSIILYFTEDKSKPEVRGRVNDVLLYIVKELGLKVCQKSIDVKRIRPSRQICG